MLDWTLIIIIPDKTFAAGFPLSESLSHLDSFAYHYIQDSYADMMFYLVTCIGGLVSVSLHAYISPKLLGCRVSQLWSWSGQVEQNRSPLYFFQKSFLHFQENNQVK